MRPKVDFLNDLGEEMADLFDSWEDLDIAIVIYASWKNDWETFKKRLSAVNARVSELDSKLDS